MTQLLSLGTQPALGQELLGVLKDVLVVVQSKVAYSYNCTFGDRVFDGWDVETTFRYDAWETAWNKDHVSERFFDKASLIEENISVGLDLEVFYLTK